MPLDIPPEKFHALSEALAHQDRIDYEGTGPKAPHGDIIYKGVLLSSRYDVLNEFVHMRKAIEGRPIPYRDCYWPSESDAF
jgi:hypothetical protein